jgi:putative oxidoreductase
MQDSLGQLILRLALGVLILFHGYAKIRGGLGPIPGMVTHAGLPSWVAYGVYVGEVVAPIALIIGWFARAAAAVIAINMGVAIYLVHRADLMSIGASGGWALELQGMYLAAALALALLGPGYYSVDRR